MCEALDALRLWQTGISLNQATAHAVLSGLALTVICDSQKQEAYLFIIHPKFTLFQFVLLILVCAKV